MIRIDYPQVDFRLRKQDEMEQVFDPIRKQWVRLTPEEWVRQNFLQYLVLIRNFPEKLMAIEREIKLGELKKRFDILVFDQEQQPWMMVECKAADVKLDEAVLQQILRYHIALPVKILVITNGPQTFAWEKKDNTLHLLENLPDFTFAS